MDSSKRTPPIKRNSLGKAVPSELQKITQQYQGLSWQLKGALGAIKGMQYRIPKQGLMITPPNSSSTTEVRIELTQYLTAAIEKLETVDYLLKELSAAHRAAYKYTRELTTAAHKENDQCH